MGMLDRYVLNERGEPVVATSEEWGRFCEDIKNRRIAWDDLGGVKVYTVFLGIDHNYGGGPPLLFETMVDHGSGWDDQWRYSTKAEALAGHAAVVAWVRGEGEKPE